jgi:hypothetical protein
VTNPGDLRGAGPKSQGVAGSDTLIIIITKLLT